MFFLKKKETEILPLKLSGQFRLRKPPLYSDLGEYRGGFLIAKILLPQKCYFWTFQKTTTFWIFFIRFFFSWWFFYWDETILCLFFIRSVDFDRFFVFALSFESKNYIFSPAALFLCFCSKFWKQKPFKIPPAALFYMYILKVMW